MTGMLQGETFTELYRKSVDQLQKFNKKDLERLLSQFGYSLLAVAVSRDDQEATAKFLQLGLNIDLSGRKFRAGASPVIVAIKLGRVECLEMLLQRDGSLANSKKYKMMFNTVPLDHLIVDSEKPKNECKIAELLLNYGADLKSINRHNLVHLARRPDLLQFLIDRGLEILGTPPLDGDLLARMLPNKDQYADDSLLRVIQILIDEGTNLSDQWFVAWSCLNNQASVVKLLLRNSPVSVLRDHDRRISTIPSLTKCYNPLCALIYTTLEFKEDCQSCLSLLLNKNVQFEWTDSDTVPRVEYCEDFIEHKSPFDQFVDIPQRGPEKKGFFLDLLRFGGVPWSKLSPFMNSELKQILEAQGMAGPRSLIDLAKHAVRKCIGPATSDTELQAKIQTLEIPRGLHAALLMKDCDQ